MHVHSLVDALLAITDMRRWRTHADPSSSDFCLDGRLWNVGDWIDYSNYIAEQPLNFYGTIPRIVEVLPIDHCTLDQRFDGRIAFKLKREIESVAVAYDPVEAHMVGDSAATMAVLMITGWLRSDVRLEINVLRRFASSGALCVLVSAPHGIWRSGQSRPGEKFLSTNIFESLINIRLAVHEVAAVADWLRAGGKRKAVLLGVSIGGLIAGLAKLLYLEDDVCGVAAGCNLGPLVWESLETVQLKRSFVRQGFSERSLGVAWALADPHRVRRITQRRNNASQIQPVFDRIIPLKFQENFRAALDVSNVEKMNTGHYTLFLHTDRIVRYVKHHHFLRTPDC